MKNKDEILRKFDEAIQYFINCSENLPGTDFCNNVDKLIDIKCDIANGVEKSDSNCNIPIVSNSLVADIRNKLTPPLNLCAMIKNLPRPLTEDTDLNNLILKEVKQTEISIKYLSNL